MKHHLVAVAAFNVTAEAVLASIDNKDTPLALSPENLMHDPHVGCYRCEKPLTEAAMVHEDCPGEPSGYEDDGTPKFA